MQGVRVDVAAGQASAASIKGVVDEMQRIITQIQKSAVSGKSGWDGKASTAFESSHTDWHAVAVRLQTALDEIEAKLTAGFRGYDDEDVTVATLLNGLTT
ncbi:WXG100 family type VII secretion target [Gordonia hydrophobica]|uniref:ESAT-6-like protein n=1 Tax=Gordonia hydrophobica TaxID=40516 RepID=A0ABZ2TWU8_9ACTN|nr:WXG100 family type VII secretion target [Gordonia hydrophobica]MBM7369358.1 WXG100 family type VII secretion target [Gordonia hydrophobica]